MKVKFEFNGKALVAFALLSCGIAFGQYVSVVNAGAAGGIIVDGATEEEIKEAILATMPVGSVSMRMDAQDPSVIYGGTWELITGDASLRLGNGSDQLGSVVGAGNTPLVPLVSHNHSMNHNHPTATTNTDTHSHNFDIYNGTGVGGNKSSGYAIKSKSGTTSTHSDSHNHTVAIPTHNGNTGTTGDGATPTLDVRGDYVIVNVWKRVG